MSFPPGFRHEWYIICIDYNLQNHDSNFREEGVCGDSDNWHRIANIVESCNVLVKFDRSQYPPPE